MSGSVTYSAAGTEQITLGAARGLLGAVNSSYTVPVFIACAIAASITTFAIVLYTVRRQRGKPPQKPAVNVGGRRHPRSGHVELV